MYFHNFGKFDSVFLMDSLACIPNIKLIRRDGILIRVNIQYDKTVRGGKTVYKSFVHQHRYVLIDRTSFARSITVPHYRGGNFGFIKYITAIIRKTWKVFWE